MGDGQGTGTQLDTTVAGNAGRPVSELVTRRGKLLAAEQTVADARRLLENRSVRVVPVLAGRAYAGAVSRETLAGAEPSAALGTLVQPLLPTVPGDVPLATAITQLGEAGATRLVVLDPGDGGYLGLVCLRGDLDHLCLDAECHAEPAQSPPPAEGASR